MCQMDSSYLRWRQQLDPKRVDRGRSDIKCDKHVQEDGKDAIITEVDITCHRRLPQLGSDIVYLKSTFKRTHNDFWKAKVS